MGLSRLIWKKKKYRVLLAVELLLLLLGIAGLFGRTGPVMSLRQADAALAAGAAGADDGYTIGGDSGFSGAFLTSAPFALGTGVYDIRITYETDTDAVNSFGVKADGAPFRTLFTNEVSLYSGIGEASGRAWLAGGTDSLQIYVNYGGGSLTVRDVEVVRTNAGSRILLFWTVVAALLCNGMIAAYERNQERAFTLRGTAAWLAVPGAALAACLPLLTDYLFFGADLGFHLLRIEGLAKALALGDIPARVEGFWLYGHGYANSIFYCDTFLAFPALLRLLGFTANTAYKLYVTAVNLATAGVAYGCFKGIGKSRAVGVLGCLLYTLAPYRLYNMYNRAAVGEYTAMIFFPLLLYGFYRIFTLDTQEKEYGRSWILPALGFTGIIQSHVLSCELAGGFTVLLCLILWKRVFRKKTFLVLAKTVAATVLLNIWFLLPFLDNMASGSYVFSQTAGETIQKRGILPAHLFYTMQREGSSFRFQDTGMMDTEPITLGIALLFCLAVYLYCVVFGGKKQREQLPVAERRSAAVAFGLGVAALIMSTCYFPWDLLQGLHPLTAALVGSLQFPTRFLAVATPCMVFTACIAAKWMEKPEWGACRRGYFLAAGALCVFFALYQMDDCLLTRESILRMYAAENMGHSGILGGEYLPAGTDVSRLSYRGAVGEEQVSILEFSKVGLDTTTLAENSDGGQTRYLELPMLYYKGYRAQDTATGERLPVLAGDNNVVRVQLPPGYQGRVRCRYAGEWYWRAAEAVSAAAWIGLIGGAVWRRRGIFTLKNRK